eukprot:gene757-9009_t
MERLKELWNDLGSKTQKCVIVGLFGASSLVGYSLYKKIFHTNEVLTPNNLSEAKADSKLDLNCLRETKIFTESIKNVLMVESKLFFDLPLIESILKNTQWKITYLCSVEDQKISEISTKRIEIVVGKLGENNFELNSKLTETIDSIIYNISQYEYSSPYSSLESKKKALDLLRFATASQGKKIYLISTTDIFDISKKRTHLEEFNVSIKQINSNLDLSISTWVTEHLFTQANKHGVPLSIFRVGILSTDENCKFDEENLIQTILSNSQKLQIWPKTDDDLISFPSFLPVDFATNFIVSQMKKGNINGKAFHLKNSNVKITFTEIENILTTFVDNLKEVSFDEWIDRISNFDQVLNVNQKFLQYHKFESKIGNEIFEKNLMTKVSLYSDLISNYLSHFETMDMY